jgi:hypothetical protein
MTLQGQKDQASLAMTLRGKIEAAEKRVSPASQFFDS